jgi:hypothetical protein
MVGVTALIWEAIWQRGAPGLSERMPGIIEHLEALAEDVRKLPDGEELPWEVHLELVHTKELVGWFIGCWLNVLTNPPLPNELPRNCWETLTAAGDAIQKLQRHFPTFSPAIEVDF